MLKLTGVVEVPDGVTEGARRATGVPRETECVGDRSLTTKGLKRFYKVILRVIVTC